MNANHSKSLSGIGAAVNVSGIDFNSALCFVNRGINLEFYNTLIDLTK